MRIRLYKNQFVVFLAFIVGVVFAFALIKGLDILLLSQSEKHLKKMAVSCEKHKRLTKSMESIKDAEISQDAFILSKQTLGLACEELEVYESFLTSKGIDPVVLKAKIKVLTSND
jgi:hypothetical protein